MAAPTKENPFQTVVLQHDLPDGTTHFDWLLAVDAKAENPLLSFRVTERPDLLNENRWVELDPRPDHRPEYLYLEGELDGDRGTVTRLGKGNVFIWKEIPHGWNMMIDWGTGLLSEYELIKTEDSLVFRRIFENHSQDPPPPLPKLKIVGDVPVNKDSDSIGLSKKIKAFGAGKKESTAWARQPNTTGTGATHVKTFHTKLTDDALRYVDEQINDWLDKNPEFEVKLVTTTIGTFTGKVKEPHLICQVWI
jgi:hypothetical protein